MSESESLLVGMRIVYRVHEIQRTAMVVDKAQERGGRTVYIVQNEDKDQTFTMVYSDELVRRA